MSFGSLPFASAQAWLPVEAARHAATHDTLFTILLVLAATALALVIGAIDVLLVVNRRADANAQGRPARLAPWTRVGMVALPLVVAVGIFGLGFRGHVAATVAPLQTLDVAARATRGGWNFEYGPDVEADTLFVPVGRAVRLTLESDAPRQLWVPAFRLRQTLAADRPTQTWFEATAAGHYDLYGAYLDGALVDSLATAVVAQEGPAFDEWLLRASDPTESYPMPEAGRILAQRNGCFTCHTTDGSPLAAPSFKGLLTRGRTFTDGTSLARADSAYVRQSILEPQAKVVEGFQPVMPVFAGKLGDRQIAAIVEFLRTLDESGAGEEGER